MSAPCHMKYFTIEELTSSATADAQGIDNTPSNADIEHLTALVDNILDPLREAWGKPIKVNSGYRSPELNKAVGGSPRSMHLNGYAADITAIHPHGDTRKALNIALFGLIEQLGLPYTQRIDEKGYRWIHVSYNPKDSRHVTLHL